MPVLMSSPFDRKAVPYFEPQIPDEPMAAQLDWQPELAPQVAQLPVRVTAPLPVSAPIVPTRTWWGLAADCCYIVIAAGAYLISCWMMALGLPLLLILVLTGGQLDLLFIFLGSLFGHYTDAPTAHQASFARDAAYTLIALATAFAGWRLPRFLGDVSTKLASRGQAS